MQKVIIYWFIFLFANIFKREFDSKTKSEIAHIPTLHITIPINYIIYLYLSPDS